MCLIERMNVSGNLGDTADERIQFVYSLEVFRLALVTSIRPLGRKIGTIDTLKW